MQDIDDGPLADAGRRWAHARKAAAGTASPPGVQIQLMDALGHGLAVLDRQGRVLYANRAAHWICREGQPVEMQESGALWAEPGELERLQGVVVDALHGQCAMITLHRGGAARSIAVVPLLRDPQWPEAGSLLMFGTSEDLPGGAGALGDFCREHRITQAERQVLAALASGTSPQDIARSGGVAISTVRTQIASVRRKVRASSIRHLIQMVATLPPWSGVPDD